MTPKEAIEFIEDQMPFTSGIIEEALETIRNRVDKRTPKSLYGEITEEVLCVYAVPIAKTYLQQRINIHMPGSINTVRFVDRL